MDPSLELLTAVRMALLGDSTVSGLVTGVYDRVPEKQGGAPNISSPYISFGPSDSFPDDYDCIDGEVVNIQVDVWSWGAGEAYSSVECRKIGKAIKNVLHDADLSLTTNALVTLYHTGTRILRDSDGVINHAACSFTSTIETP